jgi:hypothetical protein
VYGRERIVLLVPVLLQAKADKAAKDKKKAEKDAKKAAKEAKQ